MDGEQGRDVKHGMGAIVFKACAHIHAYIARGVTET